MAHGMNYIDTVGVRGSRPLAPTIRKPNKLACFFFLALMSAANSVDILTNILTKLLPHMKLRISEMPTYIGEVAVPKPGSLELLPTPQHCDCLIAKTSVDGLFDVALCEIHSQLAPKS